jgi:hypothetical protein
VRHCRPPPPTECTGVLSGTTPRGGETTRPRLAPKKAACPPCRRMRAGAHAMRWRNARARLFVVHELGQLAHVLVDGCPLAPFHRLVGCRSGRLGAGAVVADLAQRRRKLPVHLVGECVLGHRRCGGATRAQGCSSCTSWASCWRLAMHEAGVKSDDIKTYDRGRRKTHTHTHSLASWRDGS